MKALTIWQPWAQLIVMGKKFVETRPRKTKIRGLVAIHAGKNNHDQDINKKDLLYFQQAGVMDLPKAYYGAIIGVVEITACLPMEMLWGSEYDTLQERAFGDWRAGRFGYILKNPVLLQKPFPARGFQGFWPWEEPAGF